MFARFCSDTFTLAWNAGAVVTLLIPLLAFTGARLSNSYDWEQGGGENQNGGYWSDYNNPDNYDEYGQYVGPSHWWQFWKGAGEGGDGDNNNNDNGERRSPWWCKFEKSCGMIDHFDTAFCNSDVGFPH